MGKRKLVEFRCDCCFILAMDENPQADLPAYWFKVDIMQSHQNSYKSTILCGNCAKSMRKDLPSRLDLWSDNAKFPATAGTWEVGSKYEP